MKKKNWEEAGDPLPSSEMSILIKQRSKMKYQHTNI